MIQKNEASIEFISENAVLLLWPEVIDNAQHQQILKVRDAIGIALKSILIDCVVSYNSIIIYYHFQAITTESLYSKLDAIIQRTLDDMPSPNDLEEALPSTTIDIPVLYNEIAGWDLATVAKRSGLTVDDVVKVHSQSTYRAFALGFTPGFCYLASLDDALVLPRKPSPRLKVPTGAVAIAGNQTAVYPSESPGGWHIIGQTPLPMYSLTPLFSSTISVGDNVRFKPISEDEFEQLGGTIKQEFV